MANVSPKKKAPYHHGNLREALLEAAVALLDGAGAEALTLRAVARRAGVSHAAPYRHFADKAALVAAVAQQGFERQREAVAAGYESAGEDPLVRLSAGGAAYVSFALANPAHYRVMFGQTHDRAAHPELEAAGAAAYQLLVEAVEAGQRAGVVRAGASEALAHVLWAHVHGAAMLLLDGLLEDVDPIAYGELSSSVLLRGLSPR